MLALSAGHAAAGAETLRWKFAEGDTHRYVLEQTTDNTAEVQGQEIKTQIFQTVEMTWEVLSVEADGSAAKLAQTIDKVKVALESPFANFAYESGADEAPAGDAAALAPVIDALVGSRVILAMTPRGEVRDVEVPEEMIAKLKNAGPAAQALQNLATAEGMKGLIGQSTLVLPEEAVEKDATWSRQVSLPTPNGTMALTNTFTYEGADADIATDRRRHEYRRIQGRSRRPVPDARRGPDRRRLLRLRHRRGPAQVVGGQAVAHRRRHRPGSGDHLHRRLHRHLHPGRRLIAADTERMEPRDAILRLTDAGLYCPAGDFFIDPWSPVDRAVVTHAHADHARRGSRRYLTTHEGAGVLRVRMGSEATIDEVGFGEAVAIGGVRVSLHPAGHILGSAQVRVELRGCVWVVSGDYRSVPMRPARRSSRFPVMSSSPNQRSVCRSTAGRPRPTSSTP